MTAHALDREMGLARVGRPKHRDERIGSETRHVDCQDGASGDKSKRSSMTRLTRKTIRFIAGVARNPVV